MSYAWVSSGAVVTGYNVTLQPPIPTFTPGQLALLQSQSYIGSLATPTLSGWTLLTPGVNANQIGLWGRILQSGDVGPQFNWGNQFASAFINVYSGNPSSLTGIVHSRIDAAGNSNSAVFYSALNVSVAGCLLLAGATRNKTTATDGGTFSQIVPFNPPRTQNSIKTQGPAAVLNDYVQSTAANLATLKQFYSLNDASNQAYQTYTIALLPAAAPPPPVASTRVISLAMTGVGG